jgi:hypothetical protein
MQMIVSLPLPVSMTTRLMRMILYVIKTIAILGTIVSCVYGTNISYAHLIQSSLTLEIRSSYLLGAYLMVNGRLNSETYSVV